MVPVSIGLTVDNPRIYKLIEDLGAVPVVLAHDLNLIPGYIVQLHGVVVAGNFYDIPPELYNQTCHPETVLPEDDARLRFECALLKAAISASLPVLAICGGMQLLNVINGGDLTQHVPEMVEKCLNHRQPKDTFHETAHEISIVPGTKLHSVIGEAMLEVNSDHHQAINKVGENIMVNCYSPDGIIEGIEYSGHPFMLGVQWHPEYLANTKDKQLFEALAAAASQRQAEENAAPLDNAA